MSYNNDLLDDDTTSATNWELVTFLSEEAYLRVEEQLDVEQGAGTIRLEAVKQFPSGMSYKLYARPETKARLIDLLERYSPEQAASNTPAIITLAIAFFILWRLYLIFN